MWIGVFGVSWTNAVIGDGMEVKDRNPVRSLWEHNRGDILRDRLDINIQENMRPQLESTTAQTRSSIS